MWLGCGFCLLAGEPVRRSARAIQHQRHQNLQRLLAQLEREGVRSAAALGELLSIGSERDLKALTDGGYIADLLAREIEWALHRPLGWMDRTHDGPLEQ